MGGRISREEFAGGGLRTRGRRETAGEAGRTKTMAVTKERTSVWQQDMEHWIKLRPV
jgi:hypothetical protein